MCSPGCLGSPKPASMQTITSRTNPKIKEVRALRQRKMRQASGLFVIEGIRPVGEALEAGFTFDSLYVAPQRLKGAFGLGLVEEAEHRGIPVYSLTDEVFNTLAEKDNPQGLLAVAQRAEQRLEDLGIANFPWGVALVNPQDPGNIGTILRTVDAVGASGLILLDESADPYHPTAVRASMGTLFWHPVVQAGFAEFSGWATRQGYTLYGTSAHASQDYRSVEAYQSPRLLLLGSERVGLTDEQASICHALLRLPMHGRATSLNLAVAAGVLLYDMLEKSQAYK